jgi:hypothetical protein
VSRFADYFIDVIISEETQYSLEVWAQASAEPTLTTNECESFHSHLNSSFYTTHLNIFMFIVKLKKIKIEVYIKLNSINIIIVKFQLMNMYPTSVIIVHWAAQEADG